MLLNFTRLPEVFTYAFENFAIKRFKYYSHFNKIIIRGFAMDVQKTEAPQTSAQGNNDTLQSSKENIDSYNLSKTSVSQPFKSSKKQNSSMAPPETIGFKTEVKNYSTLLSQQTTKEKVGADIEKAENTRSKLYPGDLYFVNDSRHKQSVIDELRKQHFFFNTFFTVYYYKLS